MSLMYQYIHLVCSSVEIYYAF